MKKISVILSFLLCWNAVSSNVPHCKTSNDKSANELDYVTERGNDNANLEKESSNEASSGKNREENIAKYQNLNFLYQKVCV
jgi:hypothetical protein